MNISLATYHKSVGHNTGIVALGGGGGVSPGWPDLYYTIVSKDYYHKIMTFLGRLNEDNVIYDIWGYGLLC